jgi:O-methyltransferase
MNDNRADEKLADFHCQLREDHLNLLMQVVSHSLWTESTRPIDPRRSPRNLTRMAATVMTAMLKPFKLRLVMDVPVDEKAKEEGKVWPEFAHTMIGLKRLASIKHCAETVIKEGVPGDFIETGVWRGGASIFMRAILHAHGVKDRTVWVADSFQGLPPPDAEKYPADRGANWHEPEFLAVSLEQVKEHFAKYNMLDDQVKFLKGWFKDTLPVAPIKQLAVVRLDGDMYESTMDGLVNLYPKLSKGGFLIVDDYGDVEACRRAISDYREKHGIKDPLQKTDWAEVYWRKS